MIFWLKMCQAGEEKRRELKQIKVYKIADSLSAAVSVVVASVAVAGTSFTSRSRLAMFSTDPANSGLTFSGLSKKVLAP